MMSEEEIAEVLMRQGWTRPAHAPAPVGSDEGSDQ